MKYLIGSFALGFFILSLDWPLPRTVWDNLVMLIGYVLVLGPPGIFILLLLNRLVNVSFDIHYGKDKRK